MGRPRLVRRHAAFLLLAGLAAAGCRDAPTLFKPTDDTPPLGPTPYRLTFEPARDVSPTWSADGDTVFYLVEHPIIEPGPPLDTTRVTGIVHAIPREGGTAVRVFPVLQPTDLGSTSIEFVTQAPDGTLAAFQLGPLHGALCGDAVAVCGLDVDAAPELQAAGIRLRKPLSTTPPESDPSLTINYEGREFDTSQQPFGLDGFYRVREHPFQKLYTASGKAPTRVSWSPGGDRLVYSDGLRLLTWNAATGAVIAVPGSEDGVNPAWNPDGDWIVFERLERGAMIETDCEHRSFGQVICFEQRTTWVSTSKSLELIRPDGTGLLALPEGDNPAWSADGQRIFYESGGSIWSVAIDGTGAAPVPGTENGFEPALSPDGHHLAFTRVDPMSGDADIWVVEAR